MARIWNAVLDDLESKVRTDTFDFWFKDITFRGCQDGTVYLGVDDEFFKAWIEENYLDLIEDSIAEILDEQPRVELTVGDEDVPEGASAPESDDEGDVHRVELSEERVAAREGRLPDPDTSAFEDPPSTDVEAAPSISATPSPRERAVEAGLNPSYTFETFAVGESNQFARAACEAVADHPANSYNPLFVYGDVGVGKTHLLQAVGHRTLEDDPSTQVRFLSGEDFTNRVIASIQEGTMEALRAEFRENCDLLLVDDVQTIAGKEATQREFVHTFDALYNDDKQIVLTADRAPGELSELDEKLASRFGWGLCAEVPTPDLDTRMAILEQGAEREALQLGHDVARQLAAQVEGNVRDLEAALVRLSARAELMERPVTLEMARDVLDEMQVESSAELDVETIVERVADYFDITPADIRGSRRTHAISKPRQYAMYLAREHTDHSYPELGDLFGGKDHTTVLSAHDKLEARLDEDDELAELVRNLEHELL